MTDRVDTLTVTLKENWREDDVENVMRAIRMLEPVLSVDKNVSDPMAQWAGVVRERARWEEGIARIRSEAP